MGTLTLDLHTQLRLNIGALEVVQMCLEQYHLLMPVTTVPRALAIELCLSDVAEVANLHENSDERWFHLLLKLHGL